MNSKVDFAAGGIAIRNDMVLIVKNKPDPGRDDDGYWGFPKGHLEEGEKPLEAALREVSEETGFTVSAEDNSKPISETKYTYVWDKQEIYKTVWYYKMDIIEAFTKEPDDEVLEVALKDYKSAYDMLSFDNDKKLLKYVFSR